MSVESHDDETAEDENQEISIRAEAVTTDVAFTHGNDPLPNNSPGRELPNFIIDGSYIKNFKITINQSGMEDPKDPEISKEKFIDAVNKRSSEQTRSNIIENFDQYVAEPTNEVTPILVKTNFYRGETILEEKNYSVVDEHACNTRKKRKEVQMRLEDIHSHGRYVILVGGAGSGKTTIIKRYAKKVLEKEISKLESVKMVHFVNVRDLKDVKLSTRDLLFGKLIPGEQYKLPIECGYKWMQIEKNQPEIMLAFDGIDTAPWTLSKDSHDLIDYDEITKAETMMYNILYGHLFPNCWIVLTSREYGIIQFPQKIRPDCVVALKGLNRISIEILVKQLAGDVGERIWFDLQKKSLNLMLLCSTPLFLVFTVVVYKTREDPPDNLSGIIMIILEDHIHSEHSTVDSVRDILDKLKILSFNGLHQGRVVFDAREVKRVGLRVDDVQDLIIKVPTPAKSGFCRQKLLEEDYSLFFCHRAIQESLAALRAVDLEEDEFKKFVKEKIHSSSFVVVRQILCGVIFNSDTSQLAVRQIQGQCMDTKRRLLVESLRAELITKRDNPMDMLNLLITLRECGADNSVVDIMRSSIPKIALSDIPLTLSDLHAVGNVAKHCEVLNILQLANCHLDTNAVKIISEGLGDSNVQITVLDVSFNKNLRSDSLADLYDVCRRGQGLNYWQCSFSQNDILSFDVNKAENMEESYTLMSDEDTIKQSFQLQGELDLSSYNVDIHYDLLQQLITDNPETLIKLSISDMSPESSVENLCKLMQSCECIDELRISECELKSSQLTEIERALGGKEFSTMNTFLNAKFEDESWAVLGRIARSCKAKNLFLTASNLSETNLVKFNKNLNGSKINKLDVSRNRNMKNKIVRKIGVLVNTSKVEELVMGYCQFKSADIQKLQESLGRCKIERLDMSGNDLMGVDGFKYLGNIVNNCCIEQLDISECNPCAEEVQSFKSSVGKAKTLNKLNVSRNRKMQKRGLFDVGQLVEQCDLQELFIRQCNLDENTLESFSRGIGEAKIPKLDLGCYFTADRRTSTEDLTIVAALLNNITEQLGLNKWDIDNAGQEKLQNALDKLPSTELSILLNRGKDVKLYQRNKRLETPQS